MDAYKKYGGNLCKWFLNGEGICFLNGSWCVNPFSEEGCKIQNDEIFHDSIEPRFENDNKPFNTLKKVDIFRKLDANGRLVADYFIPYDDIDKMNVTPSLVIKHAIEIVREKYQKGDFTAKDDDAECYIFHNVELIDGVIGIYVIMI